MRAAAAVALALTADLAGAQDEAALVESRMLDLGRHGAVHVVPFVEFLGEEAPGERMTGSARVCGFRIGEGEAARWVPTVGVGDGIQPSCEELVAFGAVGSGGEAIGAIYRVRPSGSGTYVAPLLLAHDGGAGGWVVDDEALLRAADAHYEAHGEDIRTLEALDEALRSSG